MLDRNLIEQLGAVLKKSRGEPSTFVELIVCIRDLNLEGKTASCSKIVRKLWPEEWKEAEDKVNFEKIKWNLLCKRRRAINNRVRKSHLCFNFYIDLTSGKQFRLIRDPEKIYRKRAEDLERNLAKATSEKLKKRIGAATARLENQYNDFRKSQIAARTRTWGWTTACAILVLVTAVSILFIRKLYVSPPASGTDFSHNLSSPVVLPAIPTIEVLPFNIMTDDSRQEHFSDGLVEEIVTTLSKFPGIDVVDHDATHVNNGKTKDVLEARNQTAVRYVLQGSVRKTNDRVRITAQLNDAATGYHLWADRWDRGLHDALAVQDEITMKIVTELVASLQAGAHVRLFSRSTSDLEAFTKVLSGFHYFFQETLDDTIRARQLCREAIALDPEYVAAYALLADTYIKETQQGGGRSQEELVDTAFEIINAALAMDGTDALVRNILSRVYTAQGQIDLALTEAKKAVDLFPNSVECINWYGTVLGRLGRYKEAIKEFNRALDLNPRDPSLSYIFLGLTYRDMGRYEDAIPYFEKFMLIKPKAVMEYLHLAACYAAVGRDEEARVIIKKVLSKDPTLTVEKVLRRIPPKKEKKPSKEKQLLAEQLRRAGLL